MVMTVEVPVIEVLVAEIVVVTVLGATGYLDEHIDWAFEYPTSALAIEPVAPVQPACTRIGATCHRLLSSKKLRSMTMCVGDHKCHNHCLDTERRQGIANVVIYLADPSRQADD